MTEFKHGGDIESFAKEAACAIEDVIDLSSNINFVKPRLNIDFNQLEISSYPNYKGLYAKLAAFYGIKSDELELFNGASSGIFSLFRFLNLKKATIYSPAYLEYKKAAGIFGYELNMIDRFNNMDKPVSKNSFVIFVNPATPDGLYYDLEKLMESWVNVDASILIDESFLDFSQMSSASRYLQDYSKLYILKSTTKFWAAAGVRIGIIISQSGNIFSIKNQEPLWKVSAFDFAYLEAALDDKGFIKRSYDANARAKKMLLNIVSRSRWVKKVFPSDANYVLLELNQSAQDFQDKLTPYKILIRSCENFDGLGANHVRIAVKSNSELEVLKQALNA